MSAKDVQFRFMNGEDIEGVLKVEQATFSTPWTEEAFQHELFQNHFAHYIVAEVEGRIVAYSGVWLIVNEAHITNVAVHPDYRGRKIGSQLLRRLMAFAAMRRAEWITLEVRESNALARKMYEKLGFYKTGVRKGYYTDNKEDALIMWADLTADQHFGEGDATSYKSHT